MSLGYINIHSHQLESKGIFSCYNVPFPLTSVLPKYYSIGLHPWFLERYDVVSLIGPYCENAFAIGETGLDKLIEVDLTTQLNIFEVHISLSEKYHKPLIIHCVKAYNEIIQLKKKHNPSQAWIIHGFNKKSELAQELTRNGFYLSIGYKFNLEAVKEIPLEKLFLETDDDVKYSIEEVYLHVARALEIPLEKLVKQIEQNLQTIQIR